MTLHSDKHVSGRDLSSLRQKAGAITPLQQVG